MLPCFSSITNVEYRENGADVTVEYSCNRVKKMSEIIISESAL